MARNPRACRARSSASKPVASAQAPWTNTIVGVAAAIVVTAPLMRGLPDAATLSRPACPAKASEPPLVWLPAAAVLSAGADGSGWSTLDRQCCSDKDLVGLRSVRAG